MFAWAISLSLSDSEYIIVRVGYFVKPERSENQMKINVKQKKLLIFISLTVVLIGVFGVANTVHAGLLETAGNAIVAILGWILRLFIWALGSILAVLMYILIWIAQYNDFINSEAVKVGWKIVRDLSNMFFILILIVLAFGTLLRRDDYGMKNLPMVLVMAVLINFSKTICGLIIDFAQVIMLTFVNAFKTLGAGNLAKMLGITDMMQVDLTDKNSVGGDYNFLDIIATYILSFFYVLIAVIVVAVMVMVLVMRIVMLWIYIVLAPLAFLLSAIPAGKKYSSQWWEKFTKEVIVGPILAFFIWLSFTSLGVGTPHPINIPDPPAGSETEAQSKNLQGNASSTGPRTGLSKAGTVDNIAKFIIAIGMLIGGLMITQEMGVAGSKMAGKGYSEIMGGFKGARKTARIAARHTVKPLAKRAVRSGMGALGKRMSVYGGADNKYGLKSAGDLMQNWSQDMTKKHKEDKAKTWQKRLEKIGMGENATHSLSTAMKPNEKPGDVIKGGWVGKKLFSGVEMIKGLGSNIQAGAKRTSKDMNDATNWVASNHDNKDLLKQSKAEDIYSPNGQSAKQSYNIRTLVNGSAESDELIGNLMEGAKDDRNSKQREAWAKNIAAHLKDGGTLSSKMQDFVDFIDQKNPIKIEDLKSKVISNSGATSAISSGPAVIGADGAGGVFKGKFGEMRMDSDDTVALDFRKPRAASLYGSANGKISEADAEYHAVSREEAQKLWNTAIEPEFLGGEIGKAAAEQLQKLEREDMELAKEDREVANSDMDQNEKWTKLTEIAKKRGEIQSQIDNNPINRGRAGDYKNLVNTGHRGASKLRDDFTAGLNTNPDPANPSAPYDGSSAVADGFRTEVLQAIDSNGLHNLATDIGAHITKMIDGAGANLAMSVDSVMESFSEQLKEDIKKSAPGPEREKLRDKYSDIKMTDKNYQGIRSNLISSGVNDPKVAKRMAVDIGDRKLGKFSDDIAGQMKSIMKYMKPGDTFPDFEGLLDQLETSMKSKVNKTKEPNEKKYHKDRLKNLQTMRTGSNAAKVVVQQGNSPAVVQLKGKQGLAQNIKTPNTANPPQGSGQNPSVTAGVKAPSINIKNKNKNLAQGQVQNSNIQNNSGKLRPANFQNPVASNLVNKFNKTYQPKGPNNKTT